MTVGKIFYGEEAWEAMDPDVKKFITDTVGITR